ncbi:MAG: type II secretion system GspH family protein [Lentisphaerales bacterium]|nr:type II secretion system GspH family protein [Lentisphaerales bacterium]
MNKTKQISFTLIELLVVIAVIGILTSMLLPALSKARIAGKTAVSINNLKQIYIGTVSYIDSNDGWLYDHSTNAHPYFPNPVVNWSRMVFEEIDGSLLSSKSNEASAQMGKGSVFYQLLFCPVLRLNRIDPDPVNRTGESDYSMNFYFIKNRRFSTLVGDIEPMFVGGTLENGSQTKADDYFQNAIYNPTNQRHPAYQYTNQKALGLFKNGNITLFSKAKGIAIHPAVQINWDFQ